MRNTKQDLAPNLTVPGALDKDILIGRLCDEKKELQKRVRTLEQANKNLAAHFPDCPADILPPEVFSCDDIPNCHGREGITACWRRVLGGEQVNDEKSHIETLEQENAELPTLDSRDTTTLTYNEDQNCWECAKCDMAWSFEYDGPRENKMNYCPECGRKIVELKGDGHA